MARKGNQHKNGLDRNTANTKSILSDSSDVPLSEKREQSKGHCERNTDRESIGKKNKQKHQKDSSREKSNVGKSESSYTRNKNGVVDDDILLDEIILERNLNSSMPSTLPVFVAVYGDKLRNMVLNICAAAKEWLEQQKPRLSTLKYYMCICRDYMIAQMKFIYPHVSTWVTYLTQLVFVLSMIFLDCNIRGVNSLLRMGTTSFFTVVWCGLFSIISMAGFTKAFIFMAVSALVGTFIHLLLGILILAIFMSVSLWMYGSFWTTSIIVLIGGSTFSFGKEQIALLITTIYSLYCTKCYVGWLGLFTVLNFSFFSTDIFAYLLRNNMNEQASNYSTEQEKENTSHFFRETSHSSLTDDEYASRKSSVPSTSGCDDELTSESEVIRLLNCNDHYSALGFTRFENIDVSLLKREYRKKAMLVHPDKNMGNEKAADAFKKLQNAYEVLLDTLKRKTYDDELRREELLNYFRRFQSASQKNGKHHIFRSGSPHFEADNEGVHGESRRVACKKCGNFHKWICTERSKLRARWCQDCNDFHQAKDGDGWLEQQLHPFMFGLLHKADEPCAFICAEGRIYNATEWFICQGMRCPANTHKPSFHVNTNLSSKYTPSAKGGASSSSQRAGESVPNADINENMTEEEILEWLQNLMKSSTFESNSSNDSSNSDASTTKSGGGSSFSSNSFKKKRKGKKQW